MRTRQIIVTRSVGVQAVQVRIRYSSDRIPNTSSPSTDIRSKPYCTSETSHLSETKSGLMHTRPNTDLSAKKISVGITPPELRFVRIPFGPNSDLSEKWKYESNRNRIPPFQQLGNKKMKNCVAKLRTRDSVSFLTCYELTIYYSYSITF
jgi:hypothetical protein